MSFKKVRAGLFWQHWVTRLLLLPLTLNIVACAELGLRDAFVGSHAKDTKIYVNGIDDRQYRMIVLDNGLKTLLISDPQTEKAAAALDVNVGSSADPRHRQGLAHFLEHMLFLGTTKYPKAGEYQEFLAAHGGNHNAYTTFEHTNYFFDVEVNQLEPVLDRFAQFFIAPLFDKTYVDRERNAVHSEYSAKLKSEYRRSLDVLKEVINPAHAYTKFSVGSLETLKDDEHGILQEDLRAFYKRYYSANLMGLSVLGKQSLDQLEALVRSKFTRVANRQVEPYEISEPLFLDGVLPVRVQIEPVKELRQLSIMFPTPGISKHYRSKPLAFLGHVLGHEGQGSLLSALKRRGWAEALSAGVSMSYVGGASFHVSMSLTEEGLAHHEDVTTLLFQAINRIRQARYQREAYEEQAVIADLQFRFREKNEPIHYVSGLASNLLEYDSFDILRGNYLMNNYDADLIKGFVKHLTPDNALISLTAKGLTTDKHSKRYNTPYRITRLDTTATSDWHQAGINDEILFPATNEFLPRDLTIKPVASEGLSDKPQLVIQRNGLKVWHRQKPDLQVPKAAIYISVRSAHASDTIEHAVLTQLFVDLLADKLNEYAYPAFLASLNFTISKHSRGISIRISGFSDKQGELLEAILDQLRVGDFDKQRFTGLKTELIRGWRNTKKMPPYRVLLNSMKEILYSPRWSEEQLIAALSDKTIEDLQNFLVLFWSQVELDGLVNGNVEASGVKAIADTLEARLLKNQTEPSLPEVKVTRLENNRGRWVHEVELDHHDAAYVLYSQGKDNSYAEQAALSLTSQIVSSDFYRHLRTEQQLGYIVFSSYMPLLTVPGIVFIVQSPGNSVVELDQAVAKFFTEFEQQLMALTEPDFEQHKQALIHIIEEKPKNLLEETEQYWLSIAYRDYQFDRKSRLADAVRAMELSQWQNFYRQYLLAEKNRQLLLMTAHKDDPDAKSQENQTKPLILSRSIDDILKFKTNQPYFAYP